MIHLIDELKVIPGVVGACIFNFRDGLKASNLPAIFKPERLNVVGKHLAKLYSAGRMSFSDLTDATLHYDESVIVARELDRDTLVFAVCDPSFNHNLLTMSFNLLQEEFNAGHFTAGTGPGTGSQSEAVVAPPAAAETPVGGTQANVLLQELLAEMKSALAKVLGPMAELIFDEVAEAWMEQGAPEFSRIEALIDLLNKEIADQDKIDEYRQQVSSLIKTFQRG